MRFGRKRETNPPEAQAIEADGPAIDASQGPHDIADRQPAGETHIDLGSLLIAPINNTELRMQVDEQSGEILSVLLMGEQAAMEVRAFAAAKSPGMWAETRREIAAEIARQGGTADEREGPFGPELFVQQPITMDDGQSGVQPSRVIGHEGPRWFLRATLLGRPAVEPESAGDWEQAIREVVVRRGAEAMPPGEALPLSLPTDAQKID